MSLTQFAMVEELAFLIKDNLPCKHLILSMEEALVNFLQHDSSSDGMMELEPTNSYNRLLLHRLAEIFGFSHHSIGEGDDRHLVLERCPETSVPAILVSDLLWQYEDLQSPRISDVLSREKEASPGSSVELPSFAFSLEEREAAYLVARERIYSVDDGETRGPVKQRPQNDPIVARRMIAHALGQRIKPSNGQAGEQAKNVNAQDKEEGNTNLTIKARASKQNGSDSSDTEKISDKTGGRSSAMSGSSVTKRNESKQKKGNFREEHMGAAKRMFANALGFHPRDGSLSKCSETKQANKLSLE